MMTMRNEYDITNHSSPGNHINSLFFKIKSSEVTRERTIGSGLSSVIYCGKWKQMNVAIKQMESDEWLEEFDNEKNIMETIARLKETNLYTVKLYGYIDDGIYALVMEYMPNGDLIDYVNKHKHKHKHNNLFQLHKMTLDVAYAVKYLHDNEIIHRDIKPENVFIGANWRAKLGDFGFSVLKKECMNDCHLRGTVGYIAPELYENNPRPYSEESDMFAYAMLLYVVYSGKDMFPGESEDEVRKLICEQQKRPVIPGSCPKEIAKLMTLGWMQKPEDRLKVKKAVEILENIKPELRPEYASVKSLWEKRIKEEEKQDVQLGKEKTDLNFYSKYR